MNKVYLLLGGNLGNRHWNLRSATEAIEKNIGKIVLSSSVYETAPWGMEHKQPFLNQVILVETELNPQPLLSAILSIESAMGRLRNATQWQERTIDIDILFFNDEVQHQPNLTLPHPRLHQRKFTLVPLHEIAPQYVHPVYNKAIAQLLAECDDTLEVKVLMGSILSEGT